MYFQKSNSYTTVKLEIEGKPKLVDKVNELLSLKFGIKINFHGGFGHANFQHTMQFRTRDLDIINFRMIDIKIGENNDNEIVLTGAIKHVTLSRKTLTSFSSWIGREKVDSADSEEDSADE